MIYRFMDFELDCGAGEIRKAGHVLSTEKKPVQLLQFMIETRGRIIERQEILQNVWDGVAVSPHVLTQSIHILRRVLRDDPRQPRVIETIRNRGVRFLPAFVQTRRPETNTCGEFLFVGRSAELAILERALEDIQIGMGRIIIVSGEAGIGKTRLLREFLWRAKRHGVGSYVGTCSESEGIPPFWPWTEILEKRSIELGTDEWMREAEKWPIARRILAGEGLSDPSDSSASARHRSLGRFTRYLVSISTESPFVVGFEDAHWADDASVELLLTLSKAIEDSGLLLVITMRGLGTQQPRRRLFPGRVLHQSYSKSVELGPLSKFEVEELLRGTEIPDSPEIARDLARKSGGNPFFLTNLVEFLSTGRETWSRTTELPNSIRESVRQQVEELPDEAQSIMNVASVLGESFDAVAIARAMHVPEEEVLDALDVPLRRGFVRERGTGQFQYEFVHALIVDCLYRDLPRGVRAHWHARLGETLEELVSGGQPQRMISALARHYAEAGVVGSLEKALWFVACAGVNARRSLAYADASRFLERAVQFARDLAKNQEVILDLLLLLGDSQARSGDRRAAEKAFVEAASIAKSSGRGNRLAEVALSVAPGLLRLESGVVDLFVVGLLEASLDNLDSDDALKAKVMARLAAALYWVPGTRARRARLVEVAEKLVADKEGSAYAFVKVHSVAAMWEPSNLEWRREQVRRILLSGNGGDEDEAHVMGRIFAIGNNLEAGDLDGYEEDVSLLENMSERSPDAGAVGWYVTMYRSSLALARGDLTNAEKLAERFFKAGAALGDVNATYSFGAILLSIRWHQGRTEETLSQRKYFADRFSRVPAWRAAYSLGLFDTGERQAARFEYERAREAARSPERTALWMITIAILAEIAVGLDMKDDAATFLELLLPFSDRLVAMGYGVSTWGCVARVAGTLAGVCGEHEKACGLLENAISAERKAGTWVWLPYSQVELAAAYLRRGRSVDARKAVELAARAMRYARNMELVRVAKRAEKLWNDAKTHSV